MMIVRYFKPDFEIEWDLWSSQTGYEEGKATWAAAGLIWFKENGFAVHHISLFDYNRFVSEGSDYLIQEFGDEVGRWQIEHSNIPLEQDRITQLLKSDIIQKAEPTKESIRSFLDKGYLVRCLVNSRKLNNRDGYVGHSVVVSGYDDQSFTIQDPGLPPLKDRKVPFSQFESAWADPNAEAKELDAIKLLED